MAELTAESADRVPSAVALGVVLGLRLIVCTFNWFRNCLDSR